MTTWNPDVLASIVRADDFHVSPFREDGVTYGTPTWIWSVAVDGALYIRAYNGTASRWYQAAMQQGAGQIHAAGGTHRVGFEAADPAINDRVDAAFTDKYGDSPYLSAQLGAVPRTATVLVTPR
jgi:hypothetical protein